MTVRRITDLIWELKGQQKFDCRTKNNQQQQRWQRQGVVDKPWVIDGLWQNGVEF